MTDQSSIVDTHGPRTILRPDPPAHLRALFPKASAELLYLFQGAEENVSFLQSDWYTVRDWLDIAGYEHESLHVVLVLLIVALEQGSLCIELSQESLERRLLDLVPAAQAQAWAQRVVGDLATDDFGRLIGSSPDDFRPVIQYLVAGRRYLYFQKLLRHEVEFAQAFRARLRSPTRNITPAQVEALLHEVLDVLPLRPGGQPLVLDADQRRALELALSRRLVLISGGPGTGKTSIVLNLLRCLVRAHVPVDRIALAAPTGRAAQRLADAIRMGLQSRGGDDTVPDKQLQSLGATTLHQLLEYLAGRDQFRRHAENPLEADVVIVDEASMVGLTLMARLFHALRPDATLILLGDKDQLPSVDAGAVLAHLVPEQPGTATEAAAVRDALVILRTNHRSEAGIQTFAAAVNQQDVAALDSMPLLDVSGDAYSTWKPLAQERGVRLLEQTTQTPGELRRLLQHWADYAYVASGFKDVLAACLALPADDESPRRHGLLTELFRLLDKTRLLTLIRDGPWGCVDINRYLDQYLRPRFDHPGRDVLFPGAPVLVTRNDHARQLFNGDVGLTVRGADGGLQVVFPRQGSFVGYPAEALPTHELGFALTVHKSQGSEYGQVFLVFPPTGGRRLLTKELVYTGTTRAKELVILCATREVLRLALQKKCTRESGLLHFG